MRAGHGAAPGLRRSMAGLHTWTGLLFGWVLYAMFLTGGASYFREEISQWMRPELPFLPRPPDAAQSTASAVAALQALAPNSAQWVIELATERTNVVAVSWQDSSGGARAMLSPLDAALLKPRATDGGEFFYYFHFSLHYLPRPLARWFVGLCTMFMLVAIVSGVITHRKIFSHFFTLRAGKGPRSWMDAHNVFSVAALPFHLMITYSGLITLMTLYMPWGVMSALDGPQERLAFRAEMTAFLPPGPRSGTSAQLADVGAMVCASERAWGTGRVARVIVDQAGDAASRVRIVRGDMGRVSVSPRYMVFDGATGELLENKDAVGPAAESRGVLYGLHVGRFADIVTRWLYFLASLGGGAMVATGLVLWTSKRRARPHGVGIWIVERLNIGSIAGLPVAMAAFLWGNRLLPLHMPQREAGEIHVFFIAWALMVLHAVMRPVARAWREQFAAAALLLAALPLWNLFTGGRNLLASLRAGDSVFFGFELALLCLAAMFAALAIKIDMPAESLGRTSKP